VRMSVHPQEVGKDLRRTVELEGDRLTLTTVDAQVLRGEQVVGRLRWERVR
jgi:hypothetical protein